MIIKETLETNLELTQLLELADKDIKRVFHAFKKLTH